MVKRKHDGRGRQRQDETAGRVGKAERVPRITAETPYGECSERLTAFGGLLALVKFLDLIGFEKRFEEQYIHPERMSKLGGYRMVAGMLMLLFIGFQRLWHFTYIRHDAMLCGIPRVKILPAVSTFWRYLRSLSILQCESLLSLGSELRCRVWDLCDYRPKRVTVNVDTTVSTVYGDIEGAKIGHNKKHRGKKGLRPVLFFLAETREYLYGEQRPGETMGSEEMAGLIRQIRKMLPEYVKQIRIHADGEFIGWKSIKSCIDEGFLFTFGNKRCAPSFPAQGWYRHKRFEYNDCMYQPKGWKQPCRFVALRIRKEDIGDRQLKLLDSENYVYRVFVTNEQMRAHNVIGQYDQRADAENLISEAQKEGLLAIPSKSFQTHHAFFQIVMLAYNLWRWMKLLAGRAERQKHNGDEVHNQIAMPNHTIRIARLKMLFIAAKIRYHGNRDEIRYSVHESRAAGLMDFLKYLDDRRQKEGLAA